MFSKKLAAYALVFVMLFSSGCVDLFLGAFGGDDSELEGYGLLEIHVVDQNGNNLKGRGGVITVTSGGRAKIFPITSDITEMGIPCEPGQSCPYTYEITAEECTSLTGSGTTVSTLEEYKNLVIQCTEYAYPTATFDFRDQHNSPLSGVNFKITHRDDGTEYMGTSGSDGKASQQLPLGEYMLDVYKEGCAGGTGFISVDSSLVKSLLFDMESTTDTITVHMECDEAPPAEELFPIKIKVMDSDHDNEPVSGMTLVILKTDDTELQVTTDSSGTTQVDLPSGTHKYRLETDCRVGYNYDDEWSTIPVRKDGSYEHRSDGYMHIYIECGEN